MPSRSIHIGISDTADTALRLLTRETGNEAAAIRGAIIETARRRVRPARLALEAERLRDEPAYQAEADTITPHWQDRLRDRTHFARGDIYQLRPITSRDTESGAAVIIQADALLSLATIEIAPTSTIAATATFRPRIEIYGQSTQLQLDRSTWVNASRLQKRIGRVTPQQQHEIDDALEQLLQL